VPPDKAALPNLKARCACGTVYAVTGPAVAASTAVPAATRPPAPAARSAPAPAAALTAAPIATTPATAPARTPTRPPPWPRCANHPQVRSLHVCPRCVKGYCDACVQTVQGGAICGECDGLCVPSAQYGQKQEAERQRERSLVDDLGVIATYPLRDPLGFALLALFTWFFGWFAGYLAQGVLMLYTFHALTRVSNGDMKSFTPDVSDPILLFQPLRLAFAAFVISTGPLIAVTLLVPGAALAGLADGGAAIAHAQQPAPDPEEPPDADDSPAEAAGGKDEPSAALPLERGEPPFGAGAVALLALALLWKLAYTPVALTVAALSHSVLSTLNPVIGVGTIGRMGVTYWQAMVVYTVLALAQWGIGFGLDKIPVAGGLVRSFTDAYASLAIACTLGLAVFKKASALGWD
jgi:hypothetical protein